MASSLTGPVRNAFASVAAGATDSSLVTAVTGKKIRVRALVINQGDTTPSTVQFNSKPAGAGTSIYPALKAAANGGFVLPLGSGWFETNAGEGLSVTTGVGSTTGIEIAYSVVTP